MKISGSTALVTGANRGLGAVFARALLERGARTVYAAARNPDTVTDPDLTPIALDITDPAAVTAAAGRCTDVDLLINNAGVLLPYGPGQESARAEMEVNYFGTLAMSDAFAPVLARNGGGALVNVLSVLSWVTFPHLRTYSAAKAAAWSLTNALRVELREQGTHVLGVHAGYIDTDMAAGVTDPKVSPAEVVAQALDGLEQGAYEVLADGVSQNVKAALSGGLELLYPALTPR
ncbi:MULTISPECIES: SDR family oxidoreductase [unclassified Nonomuraea]|uniref:SDR family oxidoreductase n=1 Tax=unclassified Nonomuraea TaxID=2593643 RepID=UPI0035BEF46E